MKLDLCERAFALASDQVLLRMLKRQLGVVAGSAVSSVRRMGLSATGRELAAVRRERLRSGLRRYRRLKTLGCVRVGTVALCRT